MADKNQIHIKILFQLSWIAFNFRHGVCKLLSSAHAPLPQFGGTQAFYMASLVCLFIYLFVFGFDFFWFFLLSFSFQLLCSWIFTLMNAPFSIQIRRKILALLALLLEFRYESFYGRQSSNIVHKATHYIYKGWTSKAMTQAHQLFPIKKTNNTPNKNKQKGKKSTNRNKSKQIENKSHLRDFGLHAIKMTDAHFYYTKTAFFALFPFSSSPAFLSMCWLWFLFRDVILVLLSLLLLPFIISQAMACRPTKIKCGTKFFRLFRCK